MNDTVHVPHTTFLRTASAPRLFSAYHFSLMFHFSSSLISAMNDTVHVPHAKSLWTASAPRLFLLAIFHIYYSLTSTHDIYVPLFAILSTISHFSSPLTSAMNDAARGIHVAHTAFLRAASAPRRFRPGSVLQAGLCVSLAMGCIRKRKRPKKKETVKKYGEIESFSFCKQSFV